eukprot:53015-Chlamydomonas_euryale.AAC.2
MTTPHLLQCPVPKILPTQWLINPSGTELGLPSIADHIAAREAGVPGELIVGGGYGDGGGDSGPDAAGGLFGGDADVAADALMARLTDDPEEARHLEALGWGPYGDVGPGDARYMRG